jgi:RHS repeat-associated protein
MQRMADVIDASPQSSGRAQAVGDFRELTAALRGSLAVAGVTVNGTGVPSLDAGGRFFAPYTVQPGTQTVEVACYDAKGNVATKSLTLVGYDAGSPDAVVLSDLSGAAAVEFEGIAYRAGDRRLVADAAAVNRSPYPMRPPLEARIRSVAPPSVTPDPMVFPLPVAGAELAAGATGVVVRVEFDNPEERRIHAEADVFGPANAAPRFTSAPPLRATVGAPYAYAASAVDDDGDPVHVSFLAGPAGMQLSGGSLLWTPAPGDEGSHGVRIEAADDRGGRAEQLFNVLAELGPSNRPPAFLSAPATELPAGGDYVYDPVVTDPDGDAPSFQLLSPPPGFTVNAGSGRIEYPAIPDGSYDIEIEAADGRGGVAVQRFTLTVGSASSNPFAPLILTTPPTAAAVGELYQYFPFAYDADGDAVTFSLLQAPSNMAVDAASGRVAWMPGSGDLGGHAVLLRASDPDGAFASQFFTVNVAAQAANRPPAITRVPERFATAGEPYASSVEAVDPEGGQIAYALSVAPAGMTISASGGTVTWTPPSGAAGAFTARVAAADSAGAAAYATWFVDVRASNTPPVFTSAPLTGTVAGAVYRYGARAFDAEDAVSYAIEEGPAGMTADGALGVVLWPTDDADIGAHPVRIRAVDDRGAAAVQAFTLTVAPDTAPPLVSLLLEPEILGVGETTEVAVAAADDLAVVARALSADGAPVSLNAQGRGAHVPPAPGLIPMTASAVDAAGNTGVVTRSIRVLDPSDTLPPVIAMTAPSNGAVVTAPVAIVGSVTDPEGHLDYYTLDYARASDLQRVDTEGGFGLLLDSPAFVEFHRASNAVANGVLGTFDTTLVQNDDYAIRVTAFDVNGQGRTEGVLVGVSGKYKPGRFALDFIDLDIPLEGIPIRVTRRYDTLLADTPGDFGFGWSLALDDADVSETVPDDMCGGFPLYPLYRGARVYLTNPDGERVGFTFEPEVAANSFIGTVYAPAFAPDPGVFDTLSVPEAGQPLVTLDEGGNAHLFLVGSAYNPDLYILTRKDGTVYRYSQERGLIAIEDRNGNSAAFTPTGVVHSSGAFIEFVRDAQSRITEILAPQGRTVSYDYDARGDLAAVRDTGARQAAMTYFADPPHYLESLVDPLGRLALRTEYDADGRIVATVDAEGRRVEQTHDPEGFSGTRRDANGHVTELFYDARGNLLLERDPLGGETSFAYDADDNKTSSTDPNGHTTSYVYDERGNLLQEIDPLGGTNRYEYDALNRRVRETDTRGASTIFSHDAQGNVVAITNKAGGSSAFEYDGDGNLLRWRDPAGGLFEFAYAANGAAERIRLPGGAEQVIDADVYGNWTRVVDSQGGSVEGSYDALNRLLSRSNSAGVSQRWEYASAGPSRATDGLGNSQSFSYDESDRLTGVTDEAGHARTFELDGNGNVTRISDPLGNETIFHYDALNRLTNRIDALGGSTDFAYDPAGNLVERVDRNGRRRTFEYDALNRRTAENWMDGSAVVRRIEFSYDAAGNLTGAQDPDARYTLDYDIAGRLTRVDNAGTPGMPAVVLDYTYDAAGQRLSVSDGRGCQVTSSYSGLNRLARQTWGGDGVATASVVWSHGACSCSEPKRIQRYADAAGSNLVAATDIASSPFTGVSRITHSNPTHGVLADFEYRTDAAGRIAEVRRDGAPLTLLLDPKGQLVGTADTNGPVEGFAYDAAGNRAGAGYSVGADNRLLADPAFDYAYDAEGSLTARTERATGHRWTFAYDHRNRLVHFERRDAASHRVSQAEYRYDPFDRRIAKIVNGVTNWTAYDGFHAWADFDGAGAVTARYLYGPRLDELLARHRPGEGIAWHLGDRVRTVHLLVDAAGAPVNRMTYDAYGAVSSETAPSVGDRFRFAGREWDDESGQYCFRRRYYDPVDGRFTAQDPLSFEGRDYNLYRYAYNNPFERTDPFGEGSPAAEYAVLYLRVVASAPCAVLAAALTALQYSDLITAAIPTSDEFFYAQYYGQDPLADLKRAFEQIDPISPSNILAPFTCGLSQLPGLYSNPPALIQGMGR